MSRLVVTLNDGNGINIVAERMEVKDNFLLAWRGGQLVAMIDICAVVCAYISERSVA